MSTYSAQINEIIVAKLIPQMNSLAAEVAKIEPYSYTDSRLEACRRQLDYLSMLYDFLYEYATGTEEMTSGMLVNIVRLIEPPTREHKTIQLLK